MNTVLLAALAMLLALAVMGFGMWKRRDGLVIRGAMWAMLFLGMTLGLIWGGA